mmetsp:Transcript_17975/g.49911  ORF Transcript_17975/g.49911 Transcript_17975/m.49911 type:complete len:213 (+) Transcript_17975:382-1020(+)
MQRRRREAQVLRDDVCHLLPRLRRRLVRQLLHLGCFSEVFAPPRRTSRNIHPDSSAGRKGILLQRPRRGRGRGEGTARRGARGAAGPPAEDAIQGGLRAARRQCLLGGLLDGLEPNRVAGLGHIRVVDLRQLPEGRAHLALVPRARRQPQHRASIRPRRPGEVPPAARRGRTAEQAAARGVQPGKGGEALRVSRHCQTPPEAQSRHQGKGPH